MALDFNALGDLMKQAEEMQKKISDAQGELAGRTVSASAGGGMVTATINGAQQLTALEIKPEVTGDVAMLEDLVLAAVNEALRKSQEMVTREMGQITGGFKLPGQF